MSKLRLTKADIEGLNESLMARRGLSKAQKENIANGEKVSKLLSEIYEKEIKNLEKKMIERLDACFLDPEQNKRNESK